MRPLPVVYHTPMPIYKVKGVAPTIADDAYIAPTAIVIGDVQVGARATIWWGAVVRGDNEPIVIGPECNVQDGAVLHTDPGYPLRLGSGVSIGHQAMVHGATIDDGALIGIQSVVLNGATIGASSLVGAGAVVTAGLTVPERSMVLGTPARIVRRLNDDEVEGLRRTARIYVARGEYYANTLEEIVRTPQR